MLCSSCKHSPRECDPAGKDRHLLTHWCVLDTRLPQQQTSHLLQSPSGGCCGAMMACGSRAAQPSPGKPGAEGSSVWCISPGSSGEGELEDQHITPHQGQDTDPSSHLGTF